MKAAEISEACEKTVSTIMKETVNGLLLHSPQVPSVHNRK